MKRNIHFDRYGAENSYYKPLTKILSGNSINSSTKESQFMEKYDFTRKSSEFAKSEVNSEDC